MIIPPLFQGLCDDAAVFPPGLKPLRSAVPDHVAHRRSGYRDLVGPLVVAADSLGDLASLVRGYAEGTVDVSVTVPAPERVPGVLDRVFDTPGLRLAALEIVVGDLEVESVLPAVDAVIGDLPAVDVYLEIPRDRRRTRLLHVMRGTRYRAKFRTGGVSADLYPDEAELAAGIAAAVETGAAFKATAGLHHAIRNTDRERGFEQHGFLNLLLATRAAIGGADTHEVAEALGMRDPDAIAPRLAGLRPAEVAAVRERFVSFGTCSIDEPRDELTRLGLLGGPAGA